MNFQQAVEYIQDSKEFKDFQKGNSGFELAHGFVTVEKGQKSPWELGYYDATSDKIVVFVASDPIQQRPEEDPFKKEGTVQSLDPEKVITSLDDALAKSDETRIESGLKSEPVTKVLVILQVLEGMTMWNITTITLAFNMLNVRIDASSGDVISSELSSILNLGKRV